MPGPYYSIHELEKAAGVPMRTLRHWVNEGVIARPIGRGRTARYADSHLVEALVVKHLRETKLSLREIRRRTAKLTGAEMRALLPPPCTTTPEGIPTPPPEPTYPFTNWQVVTLMPGISLMVNPGNNPIVGRIADEIYRYYGEKPRLA